MGNRDRRDVRRDKGRRSMVMSRPVQRVQLSWPILVDGRETDEIVLKRPSLGALRKTGIKPGDLEDIGMDTIADLVQHLANLTPFEVDQIDIEDLGVIGEGIAAFFESGETSEEPTPPGSQDS